MIGQLINSDKTRVVPENNLDKNALGLGQSNGLKLD